MQYTLETEVFEELQDSKPIAIDPTLVRAAQLADIHLLNEAKARFKRRTLHVPNPMQMRKIYCFRSFALDSAHVKFDV